VGVHVVKVAGEDRRLVATGARADLHDDAAEVLARLDQVEFLEAGFAAPVAGCAGRQLLLGVAAHVGVGLGGGDEGLGLGDILADLFVFEVRFDELGERAVFLGRLGCSAPGRR